MKFEATNQTMIEDSACFEDGLRRDLVRFSKWVHRLGFTPGTAGNLSVRLDAHRLLVTPTGIGKGMVKRGDIVIVDLCGHLLAGTRKVTSEISMHLAVYAQRPDIHAVIHSHPPIATAFAWTGRALDEMLCQEAVMTLGVVPLAVYATTGTAQVAASLAPHLTAHDAILLANHGAVSYGKSLLEAFQKMETLEHLAQVSLIAHQLGSPRSLTTQQVAELHEAREKYLRNATPNTAASPLTASASLPSQIPIYADA